MRDVNIKALLVIVLLIAGCTGGGEAPQATPDTTTTTAPPAPPQVETTAPPPTTPPPWAYLFSSSTPFSDAVPAGSDKTKPLTDTDYNFALKFPSKPADYDDGAKVQYTSPTGTIYVMRFQSASGAAEFFDFALSKIETGKETITQKTLAKEGHPLDVYHRTEYTTYFGTLIQKGVFIYYLKQMGTSAYDTESYVTEKMDYLFVPDIAEEASGAAAQTIEADFSSPETPLTDVIPKGAAVESISKNDYEYTLDFPEKTYSYDTDIKASYTTPPGSIYVMRFKSVEGAEDAYSDVLSRFQRSSNINALKVALTADGKSLEAHNKVKGSAYVATMIQKGVFIYYVKMGKDQFESEAYIKSSMAYLFE
ncbi:MAG: hypothetical protein V3R93_00305 [Candidatus Hydrothermarchaeaceae archaeon]